MSNATQLGSQQHVLPSNKQLHRISDFLIQWQFQVPAVVLTMDLNVNQVN